jgi:hypothetical protein
LQKTNKETHLIIAPEMVMGQSVVEFTEQRIKRIITASQTLLRRSSQLLSQAKKRIVHIDVLLSNPKIPRKIALSLRKERDMLIQQKIPELEKHVNAAQIQTETAQKLSGLIDQIHGKAKIRIVVRPGAEDDSGK